MKKSREGSSVRSSSEYSNFEESFDKELCIEDALKNNVELMNKREELLTSQLKTDRALIYDCDAKILR